MLLTVHSANPSTRQLSYCVHKSASLVRSLSAQGISVCEQKSLHILAPNVCAVHSKPKRLSPRASLCFQSCSVSSRHQPSWAVLLNYVFGIARRARLRGIEDKLRKPWAKCVPGSACPCPQGRCCCVQMQRDLSYTGFEVLMCFSASVTEFQVYFGGNESRN